MDPLEQGYLAAGGIDFGGMEGMFIALFVLTILFAIGTAFYQFSTGRSDLGSIAFIVLRSTVILLMMGFVGVWIGGG